MNAHVQAEIARRVMILVRHFTPFEIQDDAVVDQFSPAERYVYDSNLKSYRDLKNMIQTAEEERHWRTQRKIARQLLSVLDDETLAKVTELELADVQRLRNLAA